MDFDDIEKKVIRTFVYRLSEDKFPRRKVVLEARTKFGHYSLGKEGFSHFLYLEFLKEDFPEINYPDPNGGDYTGSEIDLDAWHVGCTFYEEVNYSGCNKTVVRIGCDYLHWNDDHYGVMDRGESILRTDGEQVLLGFIELVKSKGKEGENKRKDA